MSKYPALRLAGQTSGGDPRALLVDSGGRPIVTAPSVEDKLDIIKDEQGRLWGWDPDEDKWRKVKVNSQGQLELAQEITIESPTINIGSSVEINNDEENPVPVQLSGQLGELRDSPVTGQKVIGGYEPVEMFAGNSPLDKRVRLIIKNEDPVLRVRVGEYKADLQQTGFPLEPGSVKEYVFNADAPVPIYAVSEGAQVTISVEEW